MSEEKLMPPAKFDYAGRDAYHLGSLQKMFEEHNFQIADILKNWPAYILRRDLPRFLAHYELFKKTIDLPGCIVELGVYKGASFFTWTNLLETFCTADRYRKVYGFDHFEGLSFTKEDGKLDESFKKVEESYKATAVEIRKLIELHNGDNLLPGVERCRLIEGDLMDTLPAFLEENPGLRISLLHFDTDLYEPTKFGLEQLYPLVLKGGVVCFDQYGLIPWQGETNAADEYFSKLDNPPKIQKFPFSTLPHGYLVK